MDHPAGPGGGEAGMSPLRFLRRGPLSAGPGAGSGGGHLHAGGGGHRRRSGVADGLRCGRAHREPCRAGGLSGLPAAPVAWARRGGHGVRPGWGRRGQPTGTTHISGGGRDRDPDARGGDGGRHRKGGGRERPDPRGRLAVVYTAEGRDSEPVGCLTGGAVRGPGALRVRRPPGREARPAHCP